MFVSFPSNCLEQQRRDQDLHGEADQEGEGDCGCMLRKVRSVQHLRERRCACAYRSYHILESCYHIWRAAVVGTVRTRGTIDSETA